MSTPRRRLSWRLGLVVGITIILLVTGIHHTARGLILQRAIREAETTPLGEFVAPLGRIGTHELIAERATRSICQHGQVFTLEASGVAVPADLDGFRGRLVHTDPEGVVLADFEVDASSWLFPETGPPQIELNFEPAQGTWRLVVASPAAGFVGAPHRIVADDHLCGLEGLAVMLHLAIGIAAGVPGLVLSLVFLWRERRRRAYLRAWPPPE